MARDPFHRFRNLEKARPPSPGASPKREEGRFGFVEAPATARPSAPAPAPSGAEGRFGEPRERPIEVADRREGAQPFTRCAQCQVDSSVYAATCQNCGADLSTPAQRRFNERLWSQRREEAAREQAELATRAEERAALEFDQRRAQVDLIAAEARRAGQRAGEAFDGPVGGGALDSSTPWGFRLVGRISHPVARAATLVAIGALPVLLFALGRRGGGLRLAGALVLLCEAVLFVPGRLLAWVVSNRRPSRWW